MKNMKRIKIPASVAKVLNLKVVAESIDDLDKAVKKGLLNWVINYIEARKYGNVKMAKQVKKSIDREIKKLNLEPREVYFYFGDPDSDTKLMKKIEDFKIS